MSDLRSAIQAAMKGEDPPATDTREQQPDPAPQGDAALGGDGTLPADPEAAAARAEAGLDQPKPEKPEKTDKQPSAQPRGPDGKFAPKDGGAPQAAAPQPEGKTPSTEPEQPADKQEPPKETILPPPSLPAAVKAKFASLDPDVQQAFVKLEETVQTAKADWGSKAARLNRFDEIFAPRREALAIRGLDEFQAIRALLAAQDVLDRNPLEGLAYLARQYGVDLRQLTPQQGNLAPAPAGAPVSQPHHGRPMVPQQGAPDPVLRQLVTQVQALQSRLEERDALAEQAELAKAKDEIAKFAADPRHLYFENVKGRIAALIESGQADSLEQAYDMAVWADPEVRPLLLQEQQRAAQEAAAKKAKEEADRQRAAAAKRAAGSVTGAPTGGGSAPRPASTGNLREDLLAAVNEVRGAV